MEKTVFFETIKNAVANMGNAVIEEMDRANAPYMGLAIRTPGVPSPVVNLDMLYEMYLDTGSIDKCINRAKDILATKLDTPIDVKDLTNWDKVKGKLYLRLVRTPGKNVYREVEDLFLVPYVQITPDDTTTCGVCSQLIMAWGVDEETVFEQAKSVQETIRPLDIKALGNMLGVKSPFETLIVSTRNGINGASAIFYEGVFEELYDRLGDYYLIPASVHEMLAIAKRNAPPIKDLTEMIEFINATEVDNRDRLANSVYTYDIEKETFRKEI